MTFYEIELKMADDLAWENDLYWKRERAGDIEDRLEELREKWFDIVGEYIHYDLDGVEWFDEMPPEIEDLDMEISDEIESLEIELEVLREELAA